MWLCSIFVHRGFLTVYGGVMRENRYLSIADSGLEKLRENVFVTYSLGPFLYHKNTVPSFFPGVKIHRIFRIVKK